MPTPHYWLNDLRKNRNNLEWFEQNERFLREDLWLGLENPRDRGLFTQVLIEALPFLAATHHLAAWRELIQHVLNNVVDFLQSHTLQCAVLNAIGYFHLLCSDKAEAVSVYNAAQLFTKESDVYSENIKTVIGFLWLQSYPGVTDLDVSRIPDLLNFHPDERPYELTIRLHQAIAAACNQWRQFQTAIYYAELALKYWSTRPKTDKTSQVEKGRTEHILSIAYRELGDHARADVYRERAADTLSKTGYVWQHSAMAFEYGRHFLEAGNYEAATLWYRTALYEGLKLDDSLRLQRIYHGLGLVLSLQCDLEKLDEGHQQLQEALKLAEHENQKEDIIHIRHTLAFNSAQHGDFETALREIRYGLTLCEDIDDLDKRALLMKPYQELQQMMDTNDPRLCQWV
ncbi:MAG: hypothetical protein H7X77_09660 [Anaerolineae bacterium]|nr:hypothetical protein [Anaerolineae bacterium]